MTEAPAARQIDEIQGLVDALDLVEIQFVELSAIRQPDRDDDFVTTTAIEVAVHRTAVAFGQRFRLSACSQAADFVVGVQSTYRAVKPIEFARALGEEFIERVAIMAAYPYLREGLSSAAARLGVEVPLLGLLRAGQFKLDTDDDPSEA